MKLKVSLNTCECTPPTFPGFKYIFDDKCNLYTIIMNYIHFWGVIAHDIFLTLQKKKKRVRFSDILIVLMILTNSPEEGLFNVFC